MDSSVGFLARSFLDGEPISMRTGLYITLCCVAILVPLGIASVYRDVTHRSGSVTIRGRSHVYQHVSVTPLALSADTSQELFETLLTLLNSAADVEAINVSVLAWAISVEPHRRDSIFMTDLYDELLLHVTMNENRSNAEYILTIRRKRNWKTMSNSLFDWSPNGENWLLQLDRPLNHVDLSSFVYESSFGPMSFFEASTIMVRTYGTFSDETELLFMNQLPAAERQARLDDWMNLNASPVEDVLW